MNLTCPFSIIRIFCICALYFVGCFSPLFSTELLEEWDDIENPLLWARSIDNTYLTVKEQKLIAHVKKSIIKAKKRKSKLIQPILELEGLSSAKVRHLLNNLCSQPDTSYLEIGCWKGSTWISALYLNQSNFSQAIAIDNWSEMGSPEAEFHANCQQFLPHYSYRVFSEDCFSIDLKSVFSQLINVYFYDGNHSTLSHELAFTYYNDIFDDVFIAIVDDWDWAGPHLGTRQAFEKLNYQVLFEVELPSYTINDKQNWWNGLYVAVIRKP